MRLVRVLSEKLILNTDTYLKSPTGYEYFLLQLHLLIMSAFQPINESAVKELIQSGADVNARDVYSGTRLHIQSDEASVRALIEAGADVNAENEYGNTPLHTQEGEGSVRSLIEAGANMNVVNSSGFTPIECNYTVKRVVETMASEKITRFIRNCKWLRLYKLTRTFAFNKWYCGEEDGNGGGVGRKVDHKRIMDTKFVK